MSIKSKHNISNSGYNDIVKLMDEVLPTNHKLLKNLYFAKKIMAGLGMKYEKIDVTNDEGESVITKVAARKLHHMPVTSRFLQMFLYNEAAMHMRWPKKGIRENKNDEIIKHSSDGDAWKALDNFDPEFAKDPRSIQFGLSMDGFTPFNTNASPYSCWPLVNKDEYTFLALVIPGPKHSRPKLSMFMRPLFKELKQFWKGVKAYDSYAREEFTLRAGYIWSIHDLMAYGD
ncbi:hypothetical protein U9M48_031384 [Paspalum notatum var. saurae]|uniref:Uncharacterized protein n=1 Tax=Paspalum notatum var. saurae TaxID=547442 RepID=A0AAQ3X3C5_PASNO